jgi:hypothetical protein
LYIYPEKFIEPEINYKEMKIKLLTVVLLVFGCVACSKDTYNTEPTLEFEEVNGTEFAQPSTITFRLQCTDKEGDVVDTIWVQRISKVLACEYLSRVDSFPIPNFDPPKNIKADFYFSYSYPASPLGGATMASCSNTSSISTTDTSYFRFWMRDRAQHQSDTVQSPDIVLLKQ